VDLFAPMARKQGVDLTLSVDPDLPARLIGDKARLQQVLTNLVGNALKFTPKGRVLIEAWPLPSPSPAKCRLLICVADTGIGIPDHGMQRLFKPFAQLSEGYARSHEGSGLGLSICKRLMDLMGGTMTVVSEPGNGTTVCLSLPLGVAPQEADTAPGRRGDLPAASLAGARILLAEDDDVSSMAVRALLHRRGAEVVHVRDGLQAVNALRDTPFDLVLMDIQLPVMDGLEATRLIRCGEAGPGRCHTPVIAMTAYAMTGDRETFLAAGMDGYISKPLEIGPLSLLISETMSRGMR
jgi:CheY-like chemotaxis protein/anti-sigma regulatory factor (Ser/Thr protein kinase)